MFLLGWETIALGLEAIASRLQAIAIRFSILLLLRVDHIDLWNHVPTLEWSQMFEGQWGAVH